MTSNQDDHDLLITLNVNMQTVMERQAEHLDMHKKRCEMLDWRIDDLRRQRWMITGALSLGLLLVDCAIRWLMK